MENHTDKTDLTQEYKVGKAIIEIRRTFTGKKTVNELVAESIIENWIKSPGDFRG